MLHRSYGLNVAELGIAFSDQLALRHWWGLLAFDLEARIDVLSHRGPSLTSCARLAKLPCPQFDVLQSSVLCLIAVIHVGPVPANAGHEDDDGHDDSDVGSSPASDDKRSHGVALSWTSLHGDKKVVTHVSGPIRLPLGIWTALSFCFNLSSSVMDSAARQTFSSLQLVHKHIGLSIARLALEEMGWLVEFVHVVGWGHGGLQHSSWSVCGHIFLVVACEKVNFPGAIGILENKMVAILGESNPFGLELRGS